MKISARLVEFLNGLRSLDHTIFGLVCALVIGTYCWSAQSGFFESVSPHAEDSYYNLLVQGFRSGQLNVKREALPGLAKLANPYDPAANAPYVWDMRYPSYEMSYYKGKLYLYYGVTPALVLFWPYEALTGHYCSHKDAVVIFSAVGFLVAAGLLYAAWRRYFTGVSIWAVAAGILALGLATGALDNLSSCDLHEVPHSCGFALTMLALAAIWQALHKPKWQVLWLMLASLAYGLAIGSRPTLLFGIIILLMPVAYTWRASTEPVSLQRIGLLFTAAVFPAMLIGLGLMLYNFLRFDSPFEFGWHYQLTDIQNNSAHLFGLHYLWFNLKFYFLEPNRWDVHFPFLQARQPASLPVNYYGVGIPYCGVLINYPLVWLAFAAPLAWRRRPMPEVSVLRWFVWVVVLLTATCALTLCACFLASGAYLLEFLPTLMLLAVIGILGLERAVADTTVWRRIARWSWCLMLMYAVTFSIFASIKTNAYASYILGNSLFHQGRNDESIGCFQKAVALDPESAISHIGLGNAYILKGELNEAMASYQRAVEIEPGNVEAQYDLGCSLTMAGRLDEAIIHFQKVLELKPDYAVSQDPTLNNNIAWALATNPKPGNRNGAIAVMLAEAACRKTRYQQTTMVGALAAAYAEAGRFDEAILTAQKANTLAKNNAETNFLQENQELLKLYQNHQPYHDAAARPSDN